MAPENAAHHIPVLVSTPASDACTGIHTQRTNVAYRETVPRTQAARQPSNKSTSGFKGPQGEIEKHYPINVGKLDNFCWGMTDRRLNIQ